MDIGQNGGLMHWSPLPPASTIINQQIPLTGREQLTLPLPRDPYGCLVRFAMPAGTVAVQSAKTAPRGTESTRITASIAKRSHLNPRPLGLASPLVRAPLSVPLEASPRCEVAPRVDKPAE